MKSLLETQLPARNFVAPPVQQASTITPRLPRKTLLATFRRTAGTYSSKNVDRPYYKLKQFQRPFGSAIAGLGIHAPGLPVPASRNAHGHQPMSLSLSLMRETAG